MKNEQRYQNAAALRQALEERLNRQAREKGLDVQRLRRQVAFDRFLARMTLSRLEFALKGGYALELRLNQARATRDIDIALRIRPKDKEISKYGPADIQEVLQTAVESDPGDRFEFIIGMARMEIAAHPAAGWRFPVTARLAGYDFIRFSVDLVTNDPWLGPHGRVAMPDWLGFAGIAAPRTPVVSAEQQLAEKLHAFTQPCRVANSRVKDLVDLLLLSRLKGLSVKRVRLAAEATFKLRGTQDFPPPFPLPGSDWSGPFRQLALGCGVDSFLSEAVDEVSSFCERNGLTIP